VLQVSGFGHQPDAALLRKLRALLEQTQERRLEDPNNGQVFQYLSDKRLIAHEARTSGRYSGYAALDIADGLWKAVDPQGKPVSAVKVYQTDIWLSNPDIPSTIGVPTPDNVRETFELAFQLGLLSKSTNTWTASGQLTSSLRSQFAPLISDKTNPLLLGVEGVSLLRQIIAVDGLLISELVKTLLGGNRELVSRDDVAKAFPEIVDQAVRTARGRGMTGPVMREAVEFLRRLRTTGAGRLRNAKKGQNASRAPGVLEHRVSPRLEWLTDLGYLSKAGLAKNGFDYRTTQALHGLGTDLRELSNTENWAEEVAIRQWNNNPAWRHLRERVATRPWPASLRDAYQTMRRRIGPAPLREVAFVVAMITVGELSYTATVAAVIEFAQATKGATLSGGRYRRTAENIFLEDSVLGDV
jgi:hypothetical protein